MGGWGEIKPLHTSNIKMGYKKKERKRERRRGERGAGNILHGHSTCPQCEALLSLSMGREGWEGGRTSKLQS